MEDEKKSKWAKRCHYCKRGGKDIKERHRIRPKRTILICKNCFSKHWDQFS